MADAVWDGYISGDWDTVGDPSTGTNWNPGVLPTGTATFPGSAYNTAISFSQLTTTIQSIVFNGGLRYTFTLDGSAAAHILDITGAGLSNATGQTFNAISGGFIVFYATSTADAVTFNISGRSPNVTASELIFHDSSTLGSATVKVSDHGSLDILDQANAGSSTVTLTTGNLDFGKSASAANAQIVSTHGYIIFESGSTGANAVIFNNSSDSVIDFTSHNSGAFHIGSISGPGQILTGTSGVQIHMTGNSAISAHSVPVDGSVVEASSTAFSANIGGVISGNGGITLDAGGTLILSAANTYTGDTIVTNGTIELAAGGAIAGNFVFQNATGATAILKLDATNQVGGSVVGYGASDGIDFGGHVLASGDHAVWTANAGNTGGTLALVSAAGATISSVRVSGTHTAADFPLLSDGLGGTVAGTAAPLDPNTIAGTSGNDSFTPQGGGKTFLGNGGHDTLTLTGASSSYTFVKNANGTVTVTDALTTRDGVTIISGVEDLKFTNATVFVEGTDNANVARLYSAAFNRQPDVGGLNFWEDIYNNNVAAAAKTDSTAVLGLALTTPTGASTSIAQSFIASSEFQAKYGALNDTAYITQLYANVLGRTPDAAGLSYWQGVLGTGGTGGRAAVLVDFAESNENIAKVDYTQHPTTGWLFAT